MGVPIGRMLFKPDSQKDLREHLQSLMLLARTRAGELKKEQLAMPNFDPLHHVAKQSRIDPLVVDFENGKMDATEQRFQMQNSMGASRAVDGLRVTKTFPCSGDFVLWWLKPSQTMSVWPQGEVDSKSSTLTLGMNVTLDRAEEAKTHIAEQVDLVQKFLGFQKSQIDDHNRELDSAAAAAVDERRNYFTQADEVKKRLLG